MILNLNDCPVSDGLGAVSKTIDKALWRDIGREEVAFALFDF